MVEGQAENLLRILDRGAADQMGSNVVSHGPPPSRSETAWRDRP